MKKQLFQQLMESIEEAGKIRRGTMRPSRSFVAVAPKIQSIREAAGLSQSQLARLLNVSVRTLQNWEQARRAPSGPAKALISLLESEPKLVLKALHQASAARPRQNTRG